MKYEYVTEVSWREVAKQAGIVVEYHLYDIGYLEIFKNLMKYEDIKDIVLIIES